MKYSLRLINRNGYEVHREFPSVAAAKRFAKFYPLKSFFGWIYDTRNDEMMWQNLYTERWTRCDNDTFIPYYC